MAVFGVQPNNNAHRKCDESGQTLGDGNQCTRCSQKFQHQATDPVTMPSVSRFNPGMVGATSTKHAGPTMA